MTRLFFRYFILNFFHRRFWITNITLPAGRKIKINALTRRVSLTLMRNARERLIKCLVITKKCDFASYFTSKSENNLQKKKKKSLASIFSEFASVNISTGRNVKTKRANFENNYSKRYFLTKWNF